MLGLYLVKTSRISRDIAEELSHFGSVGLVSKLLRIYSLETQAEFIQTIEALPFVESVEENSKGCLAWKHGDQIVR